MRSWAGAVTAGMALLVACTGGDGGGDRVALPPPPTTLSPPPTTVVASTTTTLGPPVGSDPPGSVTLRVSGLTLAAGSGMRIVLRAASPRLTLRRRGAGGALVACPVADDASPVETGACLDVGAARELDLGGRRGVELRAGSGGATLDEVTLTYLPVDRSMTLVTPPRPPSACPTACETAFSLTPARPGAFTLHARSGGGRPRLTLRADPASGAPPRVLATVEGGGALSITATLEPGADAVLLYREVLDAAVAPLSMEISWP